MKSTTNKQDVRNRSKMRDYGFEDDPDIEIKPCSVCQYESGKFFKEKKFSEEMLDQLCRYSMMDKEMIRQIECAHHCILCNDETHNEWIQIVGK